MHGNKAISDWLTCSNFNIHIDVKRFFVNVLISISNLIITISSGYNYFYYTQNIINIR